MEADADLVLLAFKVTSTGRGLFEYGAVADGDGEGVEDLINADPLTMWLADLAGNRGSGACTGILGEGSALSESADFSCPLSLARM